MSGADVLFDSERNSCMKCSSVHWVPAEQCASTNVPAASRHSYLLLSSLPGLVHLQMYVFVCESERRREAGSELASMHGADDSAFGPPVGSDPKQPSVTAVLSNSSKAASS